MKNLQKSTFGHKNKKWQDEQKAKDSMRRCQNEHLTTKKSGMVCSETRTFCKRLDWCMWAAWIIHSINWQISLLYVVFLFRFQPQMLSVVFRHEMSYAPIGCSCCQLGHDIQPARNLICTQPLGSRPWGVCTKRRVSRIWMLLWLIPGSFHRRAPKCDKAWKIGLKDVSNKLGFSVSRRGSTRRDCPLINQLWRYCSLWWINKLRQINIKKNAFNTE